MATRAFTDREAGCYRAAGDVFDVADDRGSYLVSIGLVEQVEVPKKAARKRAPRKTDGKEQ